MCEVGRGGGGRHNSVHSSRVRKSLYRHQDIAKLLEHSDDIPERRCRSTLESSEQTHERRNLRVTEVTSHFVITDGAIHWTVPTTRPSIEKHDRRAPAVPAQNPSRWSKSLESSV